MGWRLIRNPLLPQQTRRTLLYELCFLSIGLITIGLGGLLAFRQIAAQAQFNSAFMTAENRLIRERTLSDARVAPLFELLKPQSSKVGTKREKAKNPNLARNKPPVQEELPKDGEHAKAIPEQSPEEKPKEEETETDKFHWKLPASNVLTVTQASKVSTRSDFKYYAEVVVATKVPIPLPLRLLVECNKKLGEVQGVGRILMMSSQGIVGKYPNMFMLSAEDVRPQFTPASPLVFMVWAEDEFACVRAATF